VHGNRPALARHTQSTDRELHEVTAATVLKTCATTPEFTISEIDEHLALGSQTIPDITRDGVKRQQGRDFVQARATAGFRPRKRKGHGEP
jgi:hypothetical protein